MLAKPRASRRAGRILFTLRACGRSLSASCNLIHDCDETFNYWEPLHFLIYGSGFQTWEYSAANALRSYLYLLLHASVLWPAAQLLGETRLKVLNSTRVMYAVQYSGYLDITYVCPILN